MSKDRYRKNDVEALLKNVKRKFSKLQDAYSKALAKKKVPYGLMIESKNYLENARSILDYLMCDVFEALHIVPKESVRSFV